MLQSLLDIQAINDTMAQSLTILDYVKNAENLQLSVQLRSLYSQIYHQLDSMPAIMKAFINLIETTRR